jgi:dephospho-CoA kinase
MIIAMSGKMRHGKSVISQYLSKKYKFKQIAFADKMKETCINYDNSTPELRSFWNKKVAREVLGVESRNNEINALMQSVCPGVWKKLTHEECYGEKTKYSRLTMQSFAQGMRELEPDCWVEYLVKKLSIEGGRWVISDVRYCNEAFAIEVIENSQIWRVNREGFTSDVGGEHISETALDSYPFEIVITNNGTLESLFTKIDKIMKIILRGTRPLTSGSDIY